MLKRLQQLLKTRLADVTPATPARDDLLQLVTAALLIETARADFADDPRECAAIEQLIATHFDLDPEATADLMAEADSRVDDAVSLYEFTRLLNDQLDEKQKLDVLEMMWRVAHADGHIDKHEEHLLRRVADLLHLRHRDFVRLRHHTSGSN
ncbi:MAG: TerB family tellurite resistance protein [Gammaproteobacteria bacterium]|nr:MAG: TerB family tellurite resistance protein [Gammaproteobacteria bacterium]